MLDRIDIEGLKGVGKVELQFDASSRARVLFGVNGVGKTKSLEAIYGVLLFTNEELLRVKGERLANLEKCVPASNVLIDDAQYLLDKPSQQVVEVRSVASQAVRHSRPLVYIGAGGRSSVGRQPTSIAALGNFEERRSQHFDVLLQECESGSLRSAGMDADIRVWFIQRAQSVNPFQVEKDNLRNEIESVLKLLHRIDQRVHAERLQIDGSQRVYLSVEGRMVELGELSSGFASVVKLFQAIISGYAGFSNSKDLQNQPGVVLIDEIESHLHVGWQVSIVRHLKALFPNTQFFISTHSPLVLTQLEQGEAYLLERDAEDGVVRLSVIDSPNMKAFADVLEETFGVDLNALKRDALVSEDQSATKRALLDLIRQRSDRQGGEQA
ncbi:AAA family ATPase [Xanthomonas fragariae]|uniref:AAA family ATPase n=1 Tax=Xanthomonas fragariae TaxID=48664 RepID=UPI001F3DFF37|nr:AAA family ATPase [Xanthomonas fragariae]MDM7553596.1 AAA family ATPase [Xanthomonas fragariae]MDM7556750.1 AAA family ATPase [Xanthomonas fragariae]MDM7574471.1 AAA family ATPase [Xanthomonas fragariae]MDM7577563.1 AAA family ATPase [Xanthomonas fragariae]MDM7587762.1 AAA family ATPase [Xanthomonas fragariae]